MLHAIIVASFELLPFSLKFVANLSLSNSHDGGGWWWWWLMMVVVLLALQMKVLVLFYCRCISGVYLYQETKYNFWYVSALFLISVKFELFVSSDILFKPLFTKFLFALFFSFYISFNKFLGSTLSDVWSIAGFRTDFNEINDFIRSFFARSSST